jgi:fused signal recognition particle receptor
LGFFGKITEGLKKTRASVSDAVDSVLKSFKKIDEDLFEGLLETLIGADVGVATASRMCDMLRARVKEQKVSEPDEIKRLLKEIAAQLLSDDTELKTRRGENAAHSPVADSAELNRYFGLKADTKPSVVLMIGVNGVGKTTTIGKLAALLKAQGRTVILGAADTFRAAAAEQLAIWAGRAGVDIVTGREGTDPASVVFDAISAARARGCDVLICDTAGRLHNKKNLMDELAKIARVIHRELPGADIETLLVLDAATGQNAVNQAREFKAAAGLTGIVLTKLDGTAKGGVVLAIANELALPVKFVGVGEGIDDLIPFDPAEFAEGLF